jgi:UDP-N-acetylmuramate--alanine ligase
LPAGISPKNLKVLMKIYFIGIGGIGVSALAQYYLDKGHEVFGFDLAGSETTDYLKKKGVIFSGKIPQGTDLIIHTPAVPSTGPLLKRALANGIKVKSYPEALGELTKEYFTIAVSGTHGKSTTTSMVALIMQKAGLDPTVILGTKLKEFGDTNFRPGKSKYLVIEADEWNFSFLNYWPQIIVLTNIEREHMDTYKDLNHIIKTYKEYVSHLAEDGTLILNGDDKNVLKLETCNLKPSAQGGSASGGKTQKFSISQKEAEELRKILKIPGEHNIYNALAALTVARELGIPDSLSFEALSEYKGSWRRFEEKSLKIKNLKLKIIHDYGHHPTEIAATLKAARQTYPKKTIWCVFQPHQHQRTYYLFKDFVKTFKQADIDEIIITDIYDVTGRESRDIKRKVSSKKLVKEINKDNVIYLEREKIKSYLKDIVKKGDIIVVMGAGDIYKLF